MLSSEMMTYKENTEGITRWKKAQNDLTYHRHFFFGIEKDHLTFLFSQDSNSHHCLQQELIVVPTFKTHPLGCES